MSEQIFVTKGLFSEYKEISKAIQNSDNGKIKVDQGTFNDLQQVNGKIDLVGSGTEETILKLNGRVGITFQTNYSKISHMTIKHTAVTNKQSSALYIPEGKLILEDCVITSDEGVCIHASNPNTEVVLRRCKIYGTKHNAILAVKQAKITIENCEIFETKNPSIMIDNSILNISNSKVYKSKTNGIFIQNGSKARLEQVEIYQNDFPGIYVSDSGTYVEINNSKINNGNDVGVKVDNYASVFLQSCNLVQNKSNGIEGINHAQININNCHINNGWEYGIQVSDQSKLTITHTKLHKNKIGNIKVINCTNVQMDKLNISDALIGVEFNESTKSLITNCIFENIHDTAVKSAGGSELRIEHSKFHYSNRDVVVIHYSRIHVKNCQFENTTYMAIQVEKNSSSNIIESQFKGCRSAIYFLNHSEGHIEDCNIQHTVEIGISSSELSHIQIQNCQINQNHAGIFIERNSKGSILQCTIADNNLYGIGCSDGSEVLINIASIFNNNDYGIGIHRDSEGYIEHSKVLNNDNYGIYLSESAKVTLDNVDTSGNGNKDIYYSEGCTVKNISNLDKKQKEEKKKEQSPVHNSKLDDVMKELNHLIGMDNIKQDLKNRIIEMEISKERAKLRGKEYVAPKFADHVVLTGNPGTGKTTIAKLFGKIYKAMDYLPTDKVIMTNRGGLVAEYVGQTPNRTRRVIERAIGGVLFIDEAYILNKKDNGNDYGDEAVGVLLEEMENRRGEFVTIIAGYQREIKEFLETNPGLESRFNQHYHIDDYTPDEMVQIALSMLDTGEGITFSDDALKELHLEFTKIWRKRDESFANGRTVRNYLDKIKRAQSARITNLPNMKRTHDALFMIQVDDVKKAFETNAEKSFRIPINEEILKFELDKLNQMVGLKEVKYQIHKLISLERYYREENKQNKNVNHTLLLGNPGTGKTEVARIIAKIYEALGILERGDLVEVKRDDVVNSSGTTEELMSKYIDRAIGGTLFIDEAYQLTQTGYGDRGQQAVEVLLKEMEDKRDKFVVIAAGYQQEMESFLQSNRGLEDRFGRTIQFEDYSPEELFSIAQIQFEKKGYNLHEAAVTKLQEHLEFCYQNRDSSFGNARFVRNLVEETISRIDYRLSTIPREQRTEEMKKTILVEDLDLRY